MNETKSNNQTVHWSIKYFIILSLLILTFILAKIKIINEDRNEQLSVESTATLSSTQDEIKWSMAPPKIEVMSDWSSFRLPNGLFRTNIRYIKIEDDWPFKRLIILIMRIGLSSY